MGEQGDRGEFHVFFILISPKLLRKGGEMGN